MENFIVKKRGVVIKILFITTEYNEEENIVEVVNSIKNIGLIIYILARCSS